MKKRTSMRRATAADAPRLTEIAHAAKRHWNYPQAWIRLWRTELTVREDFVESRCVHVIEIDGRPVGFYAVGGTGAVVELDHLWVDPPFIGRGLGRALLEHALERCRELGAIRIEIDADPHAEPFYRHVGARRIGRTPAPMEGHPERYLPRLALDVPGMGR